MVGGRGIVKEVERFENTGNDDDPYFWRLKARNGEILAVSEGYDKKSDRNYTAKEVALQLNVPVTDA